MNLRFTGIVFSLLLCSFLNGQTLKEVSLDSLSTSDSKKSSLDLWLGAEVFDKILDPMYYSTIGYRRKADWGSYILKTNINQRFDSWGTQFELDLYPKIRKGLYAYLNYGYSSSEIFPKNRFGAELYISLPKALETSIGARHLRFNESDVTIFTGSLGLYRGNYYASLRPYITPISTGGTGVSVALDVRKYLKKTGHYFGAVLGAGSTPELREFGNPVAFITIFKVDSQYLNLTYQFKDKKDKNRYVLSSSFTRQETIFEPGSYFYSVRLGLSYSISI